MRKLTVISEGLDTRITTVIGALVATLFLAIYKDGRYLYQEGWGSVGIACALFILILFAIKSGLEARLIMDVHPFASFESKKICIKLNPEELGRINPSRCYLTLQCFSGGRLIWQQKEQSLDLCFLPSRKTESGAMKTWRVVIEGPYEKDGRKLFNSKLVYRVIVR